MGAEFVYLLILIIPLAYLSGWWIARRSLNRNNSGRNGILSDEYFKGLNYVLNEQPDKAIEVFTRMLEVDSETVETHLALGNLFRRRGEVDRAIRIHQNLIARPNLNHDHRALALLELGMDYMRSGLLDRAEGLFGELVNMGAYTNQAFKQLLDIYQQEKDWEKAITIAWRLESTSDNSYEPVIAQYYCELACDRFNRNLIKEGNSYNKRALNIDPNCVRASLIEAEHARSLGKIKNMIRAYKRVEFQDADYLPEIIRPLEKCYREQGKLEKYQEYLQEIFQKYGGISSLLALTKIIAEISGEDEAIKFISAELRKRPTVRGVDVLIEYAIKKAEGEIKGNLKMIKDLTDQLLKDRTIYKCIRCGFDAKLLHWQCPSCKNWNTVKPVYGVEGE